MIAVPVVLGVGSTLAPGLGFRSRGGCNKERGLFHGSLLVSAPGVCQGPQGGVRAPRCPLLLPSLPQIPLLHPALAMGLTPCSFLQSIPGPQGPVPL